jgi:hypothetical protein
MKISNLIEILNDVKDKVGDLEVEILDPDYGNSRIYRILLDDNKLVLSSYFHGKGKVLWEDD